MTTRDERQKTVADWAVECFGIEQATSLRQRAVRLLEEAIEAYQAVGGDKVMAHCCIDIIYDRPVGSLPQELGGIGVTLLALAQAAGLSAESEEMREVQRILSKPREEFTKRNAAKNALGLDTTKG